MLCKTECIKTILKFAETQDNKLMKKHLKVLRKFSNLIYDKILKEDSDFMYAYVNVYDLLEPRQWADSAALLSKSISHIKLLAYEFLPIINELCTKLASAAAFATRQQWKLYVNECLSKGGSKLFNYIAKENKAYLSITNNRTDELVHSPELHLEQQASYWESKWHKCNHSLNLKLKELLMQLIAAAREGDCNEFEVPDLDNGTYGYAKNTKGIDNWTADEVRDLPPESKEDMAESVHLMCKKAVQAIQNLINLNAMLGKPGGGSRTVCKTPMLYRLHLRSRKEVAEWEHFMTRDYDTAGKGKSALIAAAYRNLQAEVYNLTEDQVIATCHDFEKFFDTIDLPILIEQAREFKFPLLDLALTIMQHMAPRVIQCAGFCSRTILTNTSILAGCKHSVALTRVLFMSGLSKLKINHPLAPPELYVDDTAMLSHGTKEDALRNMYNSIVEFAELTKHSSSN